MVTYQEWRQEQENWGKLKAEVDRLCAAIQNQEIADEEGLRLRIEQARDLCCRLFPEKSELFNLVYQSRFQRLWEQFGGKTKTGRELEER